MGLLAMEGKGWRRQRVGTGVERSMNWSGEKGERCWWKVRWDGIIFNPIILFSTILSLVDGINFFYGINLSHPTAEPNTRKGLKIIQSHPILSNKHNLCVLWWRIWHRRNLFFHKQIPLLDQAIFDWVDSFCLAADNGCNQVVSCKAKAC